MDVDIYLLVLLQSRTIFQIPSPIFLYICLLHAWCFPRTLKSLWYRFLCTTVSKIFTNKLLELLLVNNQNKHTKIVSFCFLRKKAVIWDHKDKKKKQRPLLKYSVHFSQKLNQRIHQNEDVNYEYERRRKNY